MGDSYGGGTKQQAVGKRGAGKRKERNGREKDAVRFDLPFLEQGRGDEMPQS